MKPKLGMKFRFPKSHEFCPPDVVWTVVDVDYHGMSSIGFRATCDREFTPFKNLSIYKKAGQRQFFTYDSDLSYLIFINRKSRWQLIQEDINETGNCD
jgi:hypothetical protein